jgi:hypothetical protein
VPTFGFSTTKEILWRDGKTPISNVYHFTGAGLAAGNVGEILTDLVNAEKAIHSSDVEFVTGRIWGPTGQGAQVSDTIEIRDLAGFGAGSSNAGWYNELAVLVYWNLGRYGSKNRPQFLRKWLRICRQPTGVVGNWGNGRTEQLAMPAEVQSYITAVQNAGTDATLSTEDGKTPLGGGNMYRFLEHRQIGR